MIETEEDARILVKDDAEREVAVLFVKDSYLNFEAAEVVRPRLKQTIAEALDRGRTRFVMNLSRVGIMDSCGLAVLISLKKLAEGRGARLALSNMSAMIQRLFALTRLDRAFDVYATEAEAVAEV